MVTDIDRRRIMWREVDELNGKRGIMSVIRLLSACY